MKKLIMSVSILFILVGLSTIAKADPYGLNKTPQALSDFFADLGYRVAQGTMTLSGNATFYGYADQIWLKSFGGQTNWTIQSSSRTDGQLQQGVLYSSDTFTVDFTKVMSSPTIITASLSANTTLQWFIGGLKK